MICGRKAPLPGADSPYQGEMSRRDKRGRDAVSRRLTERSSPASEYFRWCALLGSPSRGAGSAQPRLRGRHKFATACCLRRPYLFPCAGKDRGEKGAWLRLVHAASEFRQAPMFWSGVPIGGHPTSFYYAPPDTEQRICEQLRLNICGEMSCG